MPASPQLLEKLNTQSDAVVQRSVALALGAVLFGTLVATLLLTRIARQASRMLDEMFRMGRIGRPGYELARRQLQKTYGVGVLPDSSVRDA